MKHTKQSAKKKIVGTASQGEPEVLVDDYNHTLSAALNYYNNVFSLGDYKNNVIDYAASIGITVPRSIPEWNFRGIGATCRLLLREQPISLNHINQVIDKIKSIMVEHEKHPKEDDVKIDQPVIKPVESSITPVQIWLEDAIDLMVIGKTKTLGNMITEYNTFSVTKTDAKKITKLVDEQIDKYTDILSKLTIGKDEDLIEAWGKTSKTVFKKLISELKEFRDYLSKLNVSMAAPKKDKAPIVQVAGIKFQKEYNNIKSIHPKDVIGKSEVWIFDTVTRDLIVLRALAGKLKAAGASFTNIDESKSFKKKLRKPEDVLNTLKSLIDTNKKAFKEVFDKLTTTETKASGRMADTRIIIEVF